MNVQEQAKDVGENFAILVVGFAAGVLVRHFWAPISIWINWLTSKIPGWIPSPPGSDNNNNEQ